MRAKRFSGAVAAASLLLGAAACGDDDDAADTTTTTQAGDDVATIEVTVTADGFEGLPSDIPAGLVEVTLVNDSGAYASFDISRVEDGTSEDDFAEAMAPVLQGGPFPDLFLSNVGIEAEDGDTVTSLVVLREGDHIAWFIPETDAPEIPDDESIPSDDDTTTTAGGDDEDTTTTTEADDDTTTTTGDDEQSAATVEGTLTAVAVEDEETTTTGGDDEDTTTTTEADDDTTTTTADDEVTTTEDDGAGAGGPGGPSADDFVTASLTVTEGDDSAELPVADGEIVATDYEFDIDVDGSGSTINFRNDGPQQFHHAIVMDFGTNDPDDVEAAFPTLLESEGDPSGMDVGIDMEQVDFEFGGSGVFGPDGAAGTFDASFQEGNTYVVVCFIQDRTGGPPHAIAYDMWDVFTVGDAGGDDTTTSTTEG